MWILMLVPVLLVAACAQNDSTSGVPPLIDPRPVKLQRSGNDTAPISGRQLPAEEPPEGGPRSECAPNSAPRPAATTENKKSPGALSREDIVIAMKKVEADVAACGDGRGGVVTVQWKVGADGGMLSAETVGEWARTPVGDCAARAACCAVLPASSGSLTVMYPFKLH